MSLAQAQSEYQASISTLTHNRADGSGPGAAGITAENIAYGPISRAMASWLDDQLHADTLLGFSSGYVGAGMAADASGNVYFTLVMRRKSNTTQEPANPAPAATQGSGTDHHRYRKRHTDRGTHPDRHPAGRRHHLSHHQPEGKPYGTLPSPMG